MRLPIRARLALVTSALSAVVIGAGAFLLYSRLEDGLIEGVDAALRSRAQTLLVDPTRLSAGGELSEGDESFEQLLFIGRVDGRHEIRVIESSPAVNREPLVSLRDIGPVWAFRSPKVRQKVVQTHEEAVEARLLAIRVNPTKALVVGASLDDQIEALARLRTLLFVGGPLAVILIAGIGWLVAGVALRPVERMREEAAAISASELDRRLPVPRTGDELARLGGTLNEMLARLEQALERERRFVDDASHELRTPLANLRAELELALRRPRSMEDLERVVRSAAEETENLSRLAEDLLVLARADRGRLPVRRERIDLAELVGSVIDGFRPRAAEKGVGIESRIPDGETVDLDPLRMRQALGNLLDNALRHTARGGRIAVEAARANGQLALEVSDSGPGFAPELIPRAFEPFARSDPSRTRPDGGVGLGLAIVRVVAEAHGGVAEAANRSGGGAAVTLRIPI
jgi:two-component system OmpR family sensor kinase